MAVLLIALAGGLAIGLLTDVTVPVAALDYIAIGVLAALDACIGGVRASLEARFDNRRFVVGFLLRVAPAVFVVFLGANIGLRELYIAAAVPFVLSMFGDLGAIGDRWFRGEERA
ncbi:MAG: hypothetical protein Kow0056_01630 [Coriobacteriia bacterium]